ncbi:MAG: F0F1 ATP synthase subunit epsilon [Desulfobulbaceae bacterium]|nr:F0F1 ATP synthase subunit epsilon [Desulfobulbaceae bacterium]
MAGNITLEVVTPEKVVVSEEVQIAVAPGSLGEFGVLIGHTTFLTTLKTGMIHYTDADGNQKYIFASGGFAEALPDKLTVLAESAERRKEIDNGRAEAAMERAQKRLEQEDKDIDFVRAKAALERAIHRLKLAETK